MNRTAFLRGTLASGLGCCAASLFERTALAAEAPAVPADQVQQLEFDKEFLQNWLSDLLDAMDAGLDENTRVRMMEACGRGCFNRFPFKQDIAAQGKGNLDALIEAYRKNFEIWREGETVHIRYGEVSSGCYCPAAKYRPPKPHDLHCECTRTTHQTIFETALGRPFRVEIAESLRRGGKTCHFVVHLS
jgi:hypothetical protein